MSATRRGFLGMLASSAAWLAQPRAAVAEVTGTPTRPTPSPTPAPPPLTGSVARGRYGRFLSAEEMKLLEDRLGSQERRSVRLRSFKLANGEEPATDFHVSRRPGGGSR